MFYCDPMKNLIETVKESCEKEVSSLSLKQDLLKYCFTATYPPLKSLLPDHSSDLKTLTGPGHFYFHYPYCSGRCTFCHFNILSLPEKFLLEEYHATVLQELRLRGEKMDRVQVKSVYFGGGTPSLLTPGQIREVIDGLGQHAILPSDVPMTLEIHPEVMKLQDDHYLQSLKEIGITRVSIGAQDFHDEILKNVERRHSSSETRECIEQAQKAGLKVGIDLLGPLPGQTLETWIESCEIAFSLAPDSVTFYTTSLRRTMPLYKSWKDSLPDQSLGLQMHHALQLVAEKHQYCEPFSRWFMPKSKETLSAAKFVHGSPCYPVIGLGSGAYGNWGNQQYYNHPVVEEYKLRLKNQELPAWRTLLMDSEELFHRELVISMRTGHLSLAKFKRQFQRDFSAVADTLEGFKEAGLCVFSEGNYTLTSMGMRFSDEIATALISSAVRSRLTQEDWKTHPGAHMFEHLNHFYEL